jgi:N-acetyl sugar amidotransferase
VNQIRFGLPSEVRFCQECVISNQRPNSTVEFLASKTDQKEVIHFDDNGVCDACNFHKKKNGEIDWEARSQELLQLSDRLSSIPGYNIVVPGSGGKDSAFTSHILKYKYGFRPLTVTWAPHIYTEIGRRNFESWIHIGGHDNFLVTPNGSLHRYLTKLAFENLLHPFQPFIVGQRMIGPLIARKFGIPVVFYGENQAEYGNPTTENNSPLMNPKFYKHTSSMDLRFGGVPLKEILNDTHYRYEDFSLYFPATASEVINQKIDVHYLGYYLKWDPQECFYYATQHTGFEPNLSRTEGSFSKYSSLDDKVDPFHYYTTFIKFGLGRASYDAAQEIRNGKMDRNEGISLVKKFDSEFPRKYFSEFLEYVNLTESDFNRVIDMFRSPHLWEKNKSGWNLRNPIWKIHGE